MNSDLFLLKNYKFEEGFIDISRFLRNNQLFIQLSAKGCETFANFEAESVMEKFVSLTLRLMHLLYNV